MLDRPTAPPHCGTAQPMVSIHLPICGVSPGHVRETLAQLALLDEPAFEVLVVDYNTVDPKLWEPVARECARLDPRFRFFHLGHLSSGRAGALNFARTQTAHPAKFIAVLGHIGDRPRDWLRNAIATFADPRIGAVHSPCIVRKDALDDAGGWAEWCVAEEAALHFDLRRKHWHTTAASVEPAAGLASVGPRRPRVARQAYGAVQIALRHWRPLFSPLNRELTLQQRWRVVAGWMPWIGEALALPLLVLALLLSAGVFRSPIRFEAPALLIMLPFIGLLTLRLAQFRNTRGARAVADLALSHTIAKAVWSALLNKGLPPGTTKPAAAASVAWEELALLLLAWATAAGIAHGSGTWRSILWCAVLLALSMPYLAAVLAAVMGALPSHQLSVTRSSPGAVARTEAGD